MPENGTQLATVHQFPTPRPSITALTDNVVTVDSITAQYEIIVSAMSKVMKEGEHYGTIQGCGEKKTLLKPGAEVLIVLFGLSYDVQVARFDMPNNHREYEVQVTMYANNGRRLGTGVGSCSTMESKHRYRTGTAEITGKLVPSEYWDLRNTDPEKALELLGGKGFTVQKAEDRKWYIAKQGEKVENPNPADQYNTALKVGKKRSLIDAVLNTTAASYLFTQDLEDMLENGIISDIPKGNNNQNKQGDQPQGQGRKSQQPEDYHPGTGGPQTGSTYQSTTAQPGAEGDGTLFAKTVMTPDQIVLALSRKKLVFTINEQTSEIFVKLVREDGPNKNEQLTRAYLSELGFTYMFKEKTWAFKP